MSEPQLSIRSAKARTLARSLSRRTGLSMNRLVEQALERYDTELRAGRYVDPIDIVWDLAAQSRENVAPSASSAHDDLYDEHGLPR